MPEYALAFSLWSSTGFKLVFEPSMNNRYCSDFYWQCTEDIKPFISLQWDKSPFMENRPDISSADLCKLICKCTSGVCQSRNADWFQNKFQSLNKSFNSSKMRFLNNVRNVVYIRSSRWSCNFMNFHFLCCIAICRIFRRFGNSLLWDTGSILECRFR